MEEKKHWMEVATQLDRRWIYLAVAIAVITPILIGATLPVNISPSVRSVYETIEGLPEGSVVLIACDYDPASEAELYPIAADRVSSRAPQTIRHGTRTFP